MTRELSGVSDAGAGYYPAAGLYFTGVVFFTGVGFYLLAVFRYWAGVKPVRSLKVRLKWL
jgi:hypothetical protein